MTEPLHILLEIGPKGRVVAAATDWPGLDRGARSEEAAVDRLLAYRSRYRPVAALAGDAERFDAEGEPAVMERVRGSSSTDFWGIAHVPATSEREVLPADALERRLGLLQAGWAMFDDIDAGITEPLRPGPRSAGRTRDEIARHVYWCELHQMWRKVGVKAEREDAFDPARRGAWRAGFLDAIRAYNAAGRSTRSWPIQFLIRRTAFHVMDHAWELQDRDPASRG